jgi:hypothetical protein
MLRLQEVNSGSAKRPIDEPYDALAMVTSSTNKQSFMSDLLLAC